jgi:phosphoribosylanthranilate isomerase
MIVKVCGLKLEHQIEKLDQVRSINWLGFIFYRGSKRFVKSINGTVKSAKKVGVFVNEEVENIFTISEINQLDIIQLHGDESPELCMELKANFTIIKAFGIDEQFDFNQLTDYENKVDYFLFDTKTKGYGGSGNVFNWSILEEYKLNVPFLLSGGISVESIDAIKNFRHKSFIGIDLNSGFENEPGNKNIELVKTFLKQLNNE